MFCARTTQAGDAWEWSAARVIDAGRMTYASLAAMPNGDVVLMHTIQERVGQYSIGEWRCVVARVTRDGGDTWTEPKVIAGFGAGTYPYSTPLTVAKDSRCAMAYAVYLSAEKKHQGLPVVMSEDGFHTKAELRIDLGSRAALDTILYETRWVADNAIAVSYTEMSADGAGGLSRGVTVGVSSGTLSMWNFLLPLCIPTRVGRRLILKASTRSIRRSPVDWFGITSARAR